LLQKNIVQPLSPKYSGEGNARIGLEGEEVPTLQLLSASQAPGGHGGEVLNCSYTPDGSQVLSGGWDGHLRLWETKSGSHLTGFKASEKPVSACAVSPDNARWLSGSLDGMLTTWDAMSQQRLSVFLAHTRPISAIVFDPEGQNLATSSWDRSVAIWRVQREREGRQLTGHSDIVAGCRFTPDGKTVLSWSHDGSLRIWDAVNGKQSGQLPGHEHKVTAASISPDGGYAASASRDGVLRLWDLSARRELAAARLAHEVRALFFLLDGESLVSVEANGRVAIYQAPQLSESGEINVKLPLQCAALSPSGEQIALGCDDGKLRFLIVEGLESSACFVTATRTSHRTTTVLGRLFGKSKVQHAYTCICPVCRNSFQLPDDSTQKPRHCPNCKRQLRLSAATRVIPELS
jgi:WD40 repeat protein